MKVTRANEYWGIPEPRRTAGSFSASDIAELLRGPKIGTGQLHWANTVADPSMPNDDEDRSGRRPMALPNLQRLEHSLGNEGGSSPTDGSPERWPIIMPGDKLLNAGGDVADMGMDVLESRIPKKKTARRWRIAAAPDPSDLYPIADTDSNHGAMVHQNSAGEQWLVKPPRWDEHWPAPLDVATAQLQQRMGLATPEIHQVDMNGVPTAVHRMIPGAAKAFPKKYNLDPASISPEDRMVLQKHHVLDWLIGNHDAHPGQFVRNTHTGELVGIDKGQATKHFGVDRLHPDFHPNEAYNEAEPIYNTLWRGFAQGRNDMYDPRTGELGQFIANTQSIPDEELKGMFRPFAEQAALAGKLGTGGGGGLGKPPNIIPNNVESFLSALVDRKNNLHNDFADYYNRMNAHRSGQMGKVGRRRF